MSTEAEVGAGCALPAAREVIAEIYRSVDCTDRAALHEAVIAHRDWHANMSTVLTKLADHIRAGEAERLGSQRKAAGTLGVSRRAVRKGAGK